jgi:hypothetical protein
MGSPPDATTAAPVAPRRRLRNALFGFTFLTVFSALFGGFLGAFLAALTAGEVLVDQLWQQGKPTDLLWLAVGAAVGAGAALLCGNWLSAKWFSLWAKVLKREAIAHGGQDHRSPHQRALRLHEWHLKMWLSGTIGALGGAAIVAPKSVLAVVLPPAVACAVLCAIPGIVGMPLVAVVNMGGPRAVQTRSLLGRGLFCLFFFYQGWAMWLGFVAVGAAAQAVHGDLGRAFRDMLSQMAANAGSAWALRFALCLGVGGSLLTLFALRRAKDIGPSVPAPLPQVALSRTSPTENQALQQEQPRD